MVHQTHAVVRHLPDRVRPLRSAGTAGAAVVKGDYLEAVDERGDLEAEGGLIAAKPCDHHQWLAVSLNGVVDADAVDGGHWHECLLVNKLPHDSGSGALVSTSGAR